MRDSRQAGIKMEKNLYVTSKEYAVLLHLTGNRTVTGFSIDFPTDTVQKRNLFFDMYRKGIVCSSDSGFIVAEEWKEVFQIIQTAEHILWISFEDSEQPDMLFYVCDDKAVCIENLTDEEHDSYRISMRESGAWCKELIERDIFPHIRTELNIRELLDDGLGVLSGDAAETIVTFASYRNGADTWTERVSLEKEQLIYYMKYEDSDEVVRKRAHKTEIEEILNKYL